MISTCPSTQSHFHDQRNQRCFLSTMLASQNMDLLHLLSFTRFNLTLQQELGHVVCSINIHVKNEDFQHFQASQLFFIWPWFMYFMSGPKPEMKVRSLEASLTNLTALIPYSSTTFADFAAEPGSCFEWGPHNDTVDGWNPAPPEI